MGGSETSCWNRSSGKSGSSIERKRYVQKKRIHAILFVNNFYCKVENTKGRNKNNRFVHLLLKGFSLYICPFVLVYIFGIPRILRTKVKKSFASAVILLRFSENSHYPEHALSHFSFEERIFTYM